MKKNIDPKEKYQEDKGSVPDQGLLNSQEYNVNRGAHRYKRIFLYAVLIFGIVLALTSCAGYVASEPSYVEIERPMRPSEAHIWIDGGWRWDGATRVYVHRHGYWAEPRKGHSYVSGHWVTTPRGKRWEDGHWQKENRENVHHDR